MHTHTTPAKKTILTANFVLILKLVAISVLPVLIVQLPFLLKFRNVFFINIKNPGLLTILANWDGPNYLINAQTLYTPKLIGERIFTSFPLEYFSTHLPLIPFLIFALTKVLPITIAALIVIYVGNIFLNISFYLLIKNQTQKPLLLTLFFTIIFPRLLVVKSVLSAETYAVGFLILFLLCFNNKKYLLACIFAMLGVFTKFQFIILAPALFAYFVVNKQITLKQFIVLASIALSFFALCFFYYLKFGDFFVYFKAQSANGLSLSYPYSMFNLNALWSGTHLVEVIIAYLALATYTVLNLAKKSLAFYFCLFYILLLFITPHADIPRYFAPIAPFTILIIKDVLYKKNVQLAIIAAIPAIYFYTINYMQVNVATINNWSLLLK